MSFTLGGAWNEQWPYDSFPAFQNAFNLGTDAVKGDFRVSKDNIGMVTHSSPIEIYESIDCAGKKIEKMLAVEIEKCKMGLTNFTFISVPTLVCLVSIACFPSFFFFFLWCLF